MSNLEELPSWAAKQHVPGTNLPIDEVPTPKKRRTGRIILFAILGLLALVAIAGLGYLAATTIGGDEDTATSGEGDDAASADAAAADDATTADATTADGQSASGESDDAAESTATGDGAGNTDDGEAGGTATSAVAGDTEADEATSEGGDDAEGSAENASPALAGGEPVDNSDGSIRYAVLSGGKLYLRGTVHSEEFGQAIADVALGVMGPGNVINEYEVDPDTPDTTGGPVYVEDVVLFEFNSIEVAQPFLPILDLGVLLMTQNPSVTITVVSRTDAIGSEAVNLRVSEQRGQAVVNYWAGFGIDTDSRVKIDARGEEEANEDDAPDAAARNRRVEFIIENLFG